jgi:hypothetical protein
MKTHPFILLCISVTLFCQLSTVRASSRVLTIMKVNWDIVGKSPINAKCEYNAKGKCIGGCPLTGGACVELLNYDTKVCGCQYCKFNATSNSCQGQCSNLVTGNCVSSAVVPSNDSDCVCSSCKSKIKENDYTDDYGQVKTIEEYTCDDSTCNKNTCLPVFVRLDLAQRSPLECICYKHK